MIKKRQARGGYSLMELIVGLMLVGIALSLIVPRGQTTKDNASAKTTAEELVSRFRQARQTAITKSVPVAVAFPTTPSILHTDQGYFLEGEVDPRVTERWQIQQSRPEVAYFVGTWSGPTWAPAPVLHTASHTFDPDTWFDSAPAPEAKMFIFTPSGNVVSESDAADGKFRVVVAMGVSSGGSSSLVSANSPYTVWLSPSGEVGLDKGVYAGSIHATSNKDSSPLAPFVAATSASNRAPIVKVIPPATLAGPKAYPDNVNPKTKDGNMIALDAVLTLEVRVKDEDGDPPYFQWKTTDAAIADGTSFKPQVDMDRWGGRFGNSTEVRMEWDGETKEWVGRDTWAPAPGDLGGNRYKLRCTIQDRRGGVAITGFPIKPNEFLVTTKEPWVLYKSWNAQNRAELWKMTLDGLEHTRVLSFPHQNVDFGQWAPSGVEIIVGAADGVYRVPANGGNFRKMGSINLGGPIDGCCLSPAGDALYYVGGATDRKKVRKVYFDQDTGNQEDVELFPGVGGLDDIHDLSAAQFGDKVVLLSSFYFNNRSGGFLGTGLFRKKKKRSGGLVIDAGIGSAQFPASEPGPRLGLFQSSGSASNQDTGAWRNIGQSGTTPYGIGMFTVDDVTYPPAVPYHVHILYGDGSGQIHARQVDFAPPYVVKDNFKPGGYLPGFPLNTGIADVHHPRYASVDRQSMVFISGRGAASSIYYMPDIRSPRTVRRLPLSPLNRGADQPSVSRPR